LLSQIFSLVTVANRLEDEQLTRRSGAGRSAGAPGEESAAGTGEQKWDLFEAVLAEGVDSAEARADAAAMDRAAARVEGRARP